MEAFTLLKYWRGGGALGIPPSSDTSSSRAAPTTTTTILTAVENENASESDEDNDNDDEGPFFDLEFTVPDEEASENSNANRTQEDEEEDINIEESDGEREFKFTLSPSSNDRSDPNLSLSPSEDLFFKGKLVHVDPSSFSETNAKPQFTASLLKSATKFRVFMLGLKKPKPTDKDKDPNSSNNASDSANPEAHKDKKHFTVKFKVEEVPIVSLFTSKGNNKTQKHTSHEHHQQQQQHPSEEKRFSKEVMQKYFKMVKPLYIRVSRRYADKLALNSAAKSPVPPPTPEPEPIVGAETNLKTTQTQKLSAGLSVVCKHLGKSRSASSAVAAAPTPFVSSKRRDDSLLQQQDGIQGAILHCKRSFNASRAECESSQLPRSVSHPSHEISMNEGNEKRLST
ncbi:unnamed protein product [Sphenostylis stenocarpa]|uniref:Membrane-associated kinase regulator 2 n=1 Tax=Sphenostylis stenocarpa TaxID=92480 RepID=A0AA86VWG8_9FABA|nr:unnamed protein product [Sphenostylis stenocarpa]